MSKQSPIYGIDVAGYQAGISMAKVKQEGMAFAIVKATEGPYRDGGRFTNPEYARQMAGAEKANLVTGAYHFLVETPPEAQVEHFLKVVGDTRGKILVVDFEAYHAPYTYLTPSNATLKGFIKELRRRVGPEKPIVVYSGQGFWTGGDPSGPLKNYGENLVAWDAYYRTMSPTGDPERYYPQIRQHGWGERWGDVEPAIWQFTASGRVAGFNLDVNACRLTREGLVGLAKGGRAHRRDRGQDGDEGGSPEKPPEWKRNWEKARSYGRRAAAMTRLLYWFWDGGMLNRSVNGRPASVDGPPPDLGKTERGFCADLTSWMQRAAGIPIPKNNGVGFNYDGGTQAYWLKYRDAMVPFKLSEFRDGDVAYRRYVHGVEEGHIMVNDEGQALQSHWADNTGNPGPNRRYTVAESHGGGYYQYRIPREKFWVK